MTHPHGRAIKNNEVALYVIIYKDISLKVCKTAIWIPEKIQFLCMDLIAE